ncbi:MAG: PAS domain S-box protein [Bacteroidia bacterium]|nr:PAS domain S-box protein [Bacteroidia bacterium]
MMKNDNLSEAEILRLQAEELHRVRKTHQSINPSTDNRQPITDNFSESETLKLIHELEVHKIELELQNQELMLAKELAEVAAGKFAELYDFAPSGYFTLSDQGEIIQLNLIGAKMLGKERLQLIKHHFNLFVTRDTKPIFNLFFDKVFSSKANETCEVTLTTNGNLPLHVYLTGIVAENGEQCLVNVFDITERKQAEKALRDSEKKYRHLINSANESIIIAQDGMLKFVNPMTISLLEGYSEQELIDRPFTVFIYPDDRSMVTENYQHRIANEAAQPRYTFRAVTRDGVVKWVEINAALIEWQGKPATLNFLTDITELKKSELLLKQKNDEIEAQNEEFLQMNQELVQTNEDLYKAKEHAEKSDRLKSAFLANMSHEIRTPMNGILGFASLLEEPDHTGEEQQLYIKMIEKSGARMLNIINDIIDISKIESGLMDVVITETNINENIELIYNFFKPEVEKKRIQLFYKNALPLNEAIIQTDREKIYAILTNLVKNAIKFTSEGSIEFGYNIVGTDNYLSPRQYQFYVKDTGIGIPKDKQEVVFERFIQSDISDKQTLQGAGLGLSISKAYVEMLGGKIWAESEPGKGSIFYFTIPCNSESQKNSVIAHVTSASNEVDKIRSLNILIAEDDEASEIFITTVVKKFSHKVLLVKTGVEAIEACRNNPDLDLVLMDIRMSEMDGYEATRQIRRYNNEVIIIAQTAFALTGERERAIEAGCNDYISKPILKVELLALIQKYFPE